MSIDAQLLLRSNVQIFPVRDLAPEIRSQIDAGDEDYALTSEHSRAPSRVMDKESADILEEFRTPKRIVDAVLAFAGRRGLDPESTLEQAYPLLFRLYETKLLIPAGSVDSEPIENELKVGGAIDEFRLLRCVQILDDTEVFMARDRAGQYAAVKFHRKAGKRTIQELEREAAMLRGIPNHWGPRLFGLKRTGSGIALVTEWIFGSDATTAAAAMRGRREARNERRLLTLCADIATAFADVHEAGILQGDVHPRNVLVEPRGHVRLIDFGLAQSIEASDEYTSRGGVAFYFDPEFAQAQRDHASARLTAAGEQYSVAALLYQLWTGVFYVDWSLERDELLRQIVEESPVPFKARSVPPWRALEEILVRALDKRPERRFGSMRELAASLRALIPEAEMRDRGAILRRKERAREEDLLERALLRYRLGGDALRDGPASAPFVSINYGAAGIAYALCRIARRRTDAQLNALADVWTQRAFTLSTGERAFFNPDLDIVPEVVGRVSLFHSISGLHCVRALVSIAMGDTAATNRAVQTFIQLSRGPCDNHDLTLGRTSLLLGCAELIETIPNHPQVNLAQLRSRGDEIAAGILQLVQSQTIAQSHTLNLLGVAHGWAGLLFGLLRWNQATGTEVDPAVTARLHDLAVLAEPHNGGVRWPVQVAGDTYMDGWCNGTAGHVMLFVLAEEMLRSGGFGELAERAAMSAWTSEMRLGTLCCGLGGIGYALAAVHRLTGDQVWLERARGAARRGAADNTKYFLRDALYKGAVGVAVLADDLDQPGTMAMPLFEPVR